MRLDGASLLSATIAVTADRPSPPAPMGRVGLLDQRLAECYRVRTGGAARGLILSWASRLRPSPSTGGVASCTDGGHYIYRGDRETGEIDTVYYGYVEDDLVIDDDADRLYWHNFQHATPRYRPGDGGSATLPKGIPALTGRHRVAPGRRRRRPSPRIRRRRRGAHPRRYPRGPRRGRPRRRRRTRLRRRPHRWAMGSTTGSCRAARPSASG